MYIKGKYRVITEKLPGNIGEIQGGKRAEKRKFITLIIIIVKVTSIPVKASVQDGLIKLRNLCEIYELLD